MGWIEKGRPTVFDDKPLDGLFFLDGDLIAKRIPHARTEGYKFPTIVFPSGIMCDLWESSDPDNAVVHIFGEMDLRQKDSRDAAYDHASAIAEQVGYLVRKNGDDALEAFGGDEERVRIVYDSAEHRIANVVFLNPGEIVEPPKPPILDEKSRATLPPLYSNEKLGLDAIAQVKFFTPDAHWTWYASEFDGENIFFGLVAGDEVELGYFSLDELEDAHGPLGLPIERDRFFQPTTLRELQARHRQERTERGGGGGEEPPPKDIEHLLTMKEELLQRFKELPAEHQATIGLVVVNTIFKGEWGTWFRDALMTRFTVGENAHVAPYIRTVTRADLERVHLTQEDIDQLSDTDLTTIATLIHQHYITDAFWDELAYISELVLAGKQRRKG